MDTDRTVNVALLYNVFDPTNIVREELVYQEGKTLDHYIEGLPEDCSWKIGLNSVPIEADRFNTTEVKAEDIITVVAIPRGGDGGGKEILRLVAMVALVVGATLLLGPGGALGLTGATALAATGAAIAIGGFLINLALGPTVPKTSKDDGSSYGFDGAKNTAKEGTPLPIVYGQFQVAGNYVDLFTENVGDDQYLYGRVALSDGVIDSVVGEPEINEQAISNYKSVQWGYTQGLPTDTVNTKFNGSKQQFFRDNKLDTTYVQYDTTGNVDAFEIDFVFPQGLANINKKDGSKSNFSVTVEIQYAPYGTTNWTNVGTTPDVTSNPGDFTGTSPTGGRFSVTTQGSPSTAINSSAEYSLQYKLSTDTTWTTHETFTDTTDNFTSTGAWQTGTKKYNSYGNAIYDNGYTYQTVFPERTTELTLPDGQYDFQVTGAGSLVSTRALPPTVTPGSGGVGASTRVTYTDRRTKTIRKTFKSPTLTRGRYSIRYRRTVAEDPNHADWISELHCSGVTEVQHSNVALNNVATGWYVAKMTDQLSGIPTITWKVKGVEVDIYDNNGNVTATQWSANPADIVLDMLISERRGPLRDKVTIDYPSFVQWREHCDANSLYFNGVFDSATTLWDALQNVFKVGRGFPVRTGSKLSVGVDKPTNPSQLFGPGNIYKDSFQITYLGLQDRANEFEVSYYDVTDRNKKKTIRIADPQAAQAGQIPKTVQYDLFGVDNFAQAQKEVWYQLYNNRLGRRVVSFDAPVESIGISLGDVALIQHDMMNWGNSGRLAAVANSSSVTLDRKVDIEAGKTYSLLVNHDKVSRATCNIALVSGTTYSLTSLSNTTNVVDTLKRLQTNTSAEAEILDFDYTGGTNATVTLSNTVTGTTATLWDVDVIEERTVSTGASTTDVITVSTPFSITPTTLSNYMFGENVIVKKPYRLRSISGDGLERRTLTFGEYNDYIYSAPETTVPAPGTNPSNFPTHVTNLTFSIDPIRVGTTVTGHLSWSSGSVFLYAGADVYQSVNGSDYTFVSSVQNSNNLTISVSEGTTVAFKVVAFNSKGVRANINDAPIITKDINTAAGSLVEPTSLIWTLDRVNFLAAGWISWTLGDVSLGNVSPVTRVQVKYAGTTDWLDKGLTDQTKLQLTDVPAGTHSFRVRAENSTGQISDWVTANFTVSVPTIVNPTIATDGTAIDHTINTDSSADISFQWNWAGTESDIDGFELVNYSALTSTIYTFGTTARSERQMLVSPNKRAVILEGVAANKYYTFFVRAYKNVHTSFATGGKLYSTAVKSSATGENPYQPSANVAFSGDITGTINGLDTTQINDWTHFTNVPGNLSGLTGTEDLRNDLLDMTQDVGGTSGRVRFRVISNGTGVGTFLQAHDSLQNLAITVSGGILGGIGTSGVEVDNSTMRVATDNLGTGGRVRALLQRGGGTTTINSVDLHDGVQNNQMDITQDTAGTGGRVRLRLTSSATGVGSFLQAHDSLQNLAIGVNASGQISGIGTGNLTEISNSTLRVATDNLGTGGRVRAILQRNGGATTVNSVDLHDNVQNNQLGIATDNAGTGGRVRLRLQSAGTDVNTVTPHDSLQNVAITVASGVLSGIGTAGVEVDNSTLRVSTDASGTGGRVRVLLNRNSGLTNVNTVDLHDNVQNNQLGIAQDTLGTGGRVRLRLQSAGTDVNTITPSDGLQNKGITITSGVLGGIGTSNVEVDNSTLRVSTDSSGTGGRVRVLLQRSSGLTNVNTVDLHDNVQNSQIGSWTALGDANRVRFSRMEKGNTGYTIYDSYSGFNNIIGVATFQNKTLLNINGSFTAASQVASVGTTGAGVLGSPYSIPVLGNERLFIGAQIGAAIPAGGSVILRIYYYDSTAAGVGSTDLYTGSSGLGTYTRVGGFSTVPATAAFAAVVLYAVCGGTTGSWSLNLADVMVCGAGASQTVWPSFNAGPTGESGAEVTKWVPAPLESTVFNYDYQGVAEAGQFPRTLNFKLMSSSGQITSGVSWSLIVKSGGFNAITSSSGSFVMSTSDGVGSQLVNSLETDTAVIEITATYNSATYKYNLSLSRQYAAPPITGGGSGSTLMSKSSGFNAINSTTPTDVTGTQTFSYSGTVSLNATLTFSPEIPGPGSWTVNLKWQQLISGSWTDLTTPSPTVQTGATDVVAASGGDPAFSDSATITNNKTITASGSTSVRCLAYLSSGTKIHNITGTVSATS